MSAATPNIQPEFEIRTGLTHEDLTQIEDIQRTVWGPDDVVPSAQLRAVEHAGGQLSAAFRHGHLIGFSYGFLATPHGRGMTGLGLHSHMVAVLNEGRGLGVGQALKWQQRLWALERGIDWISWTFDPLQARNARLNLEYLGAVALDYLTDFYGEMPGPLGGGQASDRLLALWRLEAPRVMRRLPQAATNAGPAPSSGQAAFWAVRPVSQAEDAEPLLAPVPDDVQLVNVAVPPDVTRLFSADPELVRRWRAAVRVTMTRLLEGGYAVVGFQDGAYRVKRDPNPNLRE